MRSLLVRKAKTGATRLDEADKIAKEKTQTVFFPRKNNQMQKDGSGSGTFYFWSNLSGQNASVSPLKNRWTNVTKGDGFFNLRALKTIF